jgi:hypothetical protein
VARIIGVAVVVVVVLGLLLVVLGAFTGLAVAVFEVMRAI